MLVKKEVIRPGTYFYTDEKTGGPRKLVVTSAMTKHWHDRGNEMLSAGLTVPVPFEHDFSAHPMTPKEKLLNNSGWIKDYERDGDVLFANVDVQDEEVAKKLPRTVRWTSPWINSFVDGDGKRWENVISHLALTTRPRIVRQEPFGSVAAALSLAKEESSESYCLSRAGLLLGDLPAYPVAFSMWTGAALAAEHKPKGPGGGQFTCHEGAHAASKAACLASDGIDGPNKAPRSSSVAEKASAIGDHRTAAEAHKGAANFHKKQGDDSFGGDSRKLSGSVMKKHREAAQAHKEAAMLHHDLAEEKGQGTPDYNKKDGAAMATKDEQQPPEAEPPEQPAEAAAPPEDPMAGLADPLQDSGGDVKMEELLCDLLQALGVPMPDESNEGEFKRHLYEAAMSKIKELTSKGMVGEKPAQPKPDQNKPPTQNPNISHAGKANPLLPQVQQEQQPMYMSIGGRKVDVIMSLEDIQRIEDPTTRAVALSMHQQNQALLARVEAAERSSTAMRENKLGEEAKKRRTRVQLLGKAGGPKVQENLDSMLALQSMALSLDAAGGVVDPMRATLDTLEAALGNMPAMLTTDHGGLIALPQPTDEGALSPEGEASLVDSFSRMMGAVPEAKAG